MTPVRVVLIGARGRMGQTISALAKSDADYELVAELDLGDSLKLAAGNCDAVIDFSHPEATAQVTDACLASGRALVVGTTGHSAEQVACMQAAAREIPVVLAPNFSVGVNTLFWLTKKAAELLGPDFDLEVVEMHHRLKKDAPSGTAKRLAEILAEVRNLSYATQVAHGREGQVGARPDDEIGMHALRGGDVVGDHTVVFAGQGERLELTHKASSRDTFGKGALRAARWAVSQTPGLYSMQDVLGLAG